MSEQSGRDEPAGKAGSGQPRGADRSRTGRSPEPARRQPGSDMLSDLQRWLIRSSARNMRSQFEDQFRRTFSGQRPDNSDVWDIATTEIPPEVGESPECQWCPICRAARRMRDTRPGLSGQLSGAGDAVAAAVQDAVRSFDTFLTRAAGGSRAGSGSPGSHDQPGDRADASPSDSDRPGSPKPDSGGAAARPDSLAGEHGPVGWKPGDRLATAGPAVADPWATATAPGEPAHGGTSDGGTSDGGTSDGETSDDGPSDGGTKDTRDSGGSASGGSDGRGHGPSDRS